MEKTVEHLVIAAMMDSESGRAACLENLTLKDFHDEECRLYFEAIQKHEANARPIDSLAIFHSLEGKVSPVNWCDFDDLRNNSPAWYEHMQNLKERNARRAILSHHKKTEQLMKQGSSSQEIIASHLEVIDSIQRKDPHKLVMIGENNEQYYDNKIEQMYSPKPEYGIQTGFKLLDDNLLGLEDGQLYIIAGRPGWGKSAAALQIALHAATNGTYVLFFSIEMGEIQQKNRIVANLGNIDHFLVRKAYLVQNTKEGKDETRLNAMTGVLSLLETLPLCFDYESECSCNHIRNSIRKFRNKIGRDKKILVIVDHLQKMKHEKADSKYQSVGETTKVLELGIAKKEEIPIILLSQLNRSLESRADKTPNLADLKESGDIEQNANSVIFVYRPDQYKTPEEAQMIIAKSRDGETGYRHMRFEGKYVRFEEVQTRAA